MSGTQLPGGQETHAAGIVVALSGDRATVHFVRGKMCEHCGACISVGEKEMETVVANSLNAKVGDRVMVSLAAKQVVRASLLAYAVPLAFLLVGVWLGSQISDIAALILGAVGCGCAYLVLRLLEKRRNLQAAFLPEMTKILPPEEIQE